MLPRTASATDVGPASGSRVVHGSAALSFVASLVSACAHDRGGRPAAARTLVRSSHDARNSAPRGPSSTTSWLRSRNRIGLTGDVGGYRRRGTIEKHGGPGFYGQHLPDGLEPDRGPIVQQLLDGSCVPQATGARSRRQQELAHEPALRSPHPRLDRYIEADLAAIQHVSRNHVS